MTPSERDELRNTKNGIDAIEYLSEYIEMKGYKVNSHYLAIKKWVIDAVKERNRKRNQALEQDEKDEWINEMYRAALNRSMSDD